MPVSSTVIANEFIRLAGEKCRQLTNMQLQKLVFIANGFMLGLFGRPLYREESRAWQWGPVIPELYDILRTYGRNVVTENIETKDQMPSDANDEKNIIKAVWVAYGHMTASQLSALTHQPNTPWKNTWERNKFGTISNSLIENYYSQ